MKAIKLKYNSIPLLVRILIAIVLGILLGNVFPDFLVRIFVTFNSLFSNFLQFLIPLIVVGLVTPSISTIGKKVGAILLLTVSIAYFDTVFSGLLSYFVSINAFPLLMENFQTSNTTVAISNETLPFFTISMPPLMDIMTSLILSILLGIGIAPIHNSKLNEVFTEFKGIIENTIVKIIIPLLPVYIFGTFLTMTNSGQIFEIVFMFATIILVIFIMHIFLLVFQYIIAGVIVKKNPFKLLYNMLPAYFTALGTSSSVATIPVSLRCVEKNGVGRNISGFSVPLCATIHLSGSTLKITSCAIAIMLIQGMPIQFSSMIGFILMLGIMMVAAPGVPGGAIMAALGILSSILGFDQQQQTLMITLYIAMDSFGTACNVTGDGAIAIIVNKMNNKILRKHEFSEKYHNT